MTKVSLILPTYNNVAFLAQTMDSIVKQTLRGIEVIVIDDCSDDDSQDLIRFYTKKYKYVRCVSLEARKGAAYCRNLGNALSQSEIILVCDSGDVNHISRAHDAYHFLRKRKEIDIYSSACVEINSLDEQVQVHYPRIFTDKEKPSLFHPTVAYRKSVTDKIKYREGNLATDQYEAFFFEAYRAGFKFWYTTEVMVKKLRTAESIGISQLRHEQRMRNYKEFGIELLPV